MMVRSPLPEANVWPFGLKTNTPYLLIVFVAEEHGEPLVGDNIPLGG